MEQNNLTEGSVLKSLISLSVPIVLANILQAAYQMVDTFWVGRLGAEAIAAVSISFPVIFLLISFGLGLAMAGSILTAQYKGKADQGAINHIAGQTLLMVFFVSIIISVVGYYFSPGLIKLMGAEESVFLNAVSYLQISFLGIVFMFVYLVFQSLMRGVGNVKVPMFIVLGTVLLNAILDPLFIFGYGSFPAMGVPGAALATIITQGLSALVGVLILFFSKKDIHISINKLRFDFPLIKKMFFLGLPSSIEHSTRSLGMIVMAFLVVSFGTVTMAAYGIGTRMMSLAVIPAIGLSMAASTLVGQNMGAGKIERAERTAAISALVGFFSLSFLGVFMFVFAEGICSFFIPGETETIKSAALFLRFIVFSFGLIGIHQPILGVFRGAGNTISPMVFTVVLLWVVQFPLAYILSKHTGLAEVGIWIAFPVASFVSTILIFLWFVKGSWKEKRITEEIRVLERVSEETTIEGGIKGGF